METFATPANFLSETAARSSSRGFLPWKRETDDLSSEPPHLDQPEYREKGEGERGGGLWRKEEEGGEGLVKLSGTVTEAESGRIQRLFLFSGNLLPARIRADARFLIVRATPRTLSSFSLIPLARCSRPGFQPISSLSLVRKDRSEGATTRRHRSAAVTMKITRL